MNEERNNETENYFNEKIKNNNITPKDIAFLILLNKNYECMNYKCNRWIIIHKDGTILQVTVESIMAYASFILEPLIEKIMNNVDNNSVDNEADDNRIIIIDRLKKLIKVLNTHAFKKEILHCLVLLRNNLM